MKKLLFSFLMVSVCFLGNSQLQKVTIEETVLSGTVGATDFTGYTNYRLFAEVADATDQVTAVIGNSVCSANVTTSTDFYRSPVITSVQPLTDQINPAFFAFAPDLIHSSGLGIGLGAAGTQGIPRDEDTDGDGLGASIGGSSNLVAAQGEEFWNDFQTTGQSFAIDTDNGGSWFTLPGGANALGFGVNNSVFLGSFTTTGDFSYELSVGIQDDTAGSSESVDYISCDESGIDNLIYPLVGCGDETANNYDPFVDVSDLSSCTYDISGCTDDTACNYDSTATVDDSSCTYAAEGLDCDGNCLAGVAVVYTAGAYAGENSFTITDCDGNILAEMASNTGAFSGCIELPAIYSVTLDDTYGDGWNTGSLSVDGVAYSLPDADGDFTTTNNFAQWMTGPVSTDVGSCPVYGCTDATAANYDETATVNETSSTDATDPCTYGVPGCTDDTACNYDSAATADDGNCTYAAEGFDCDGNCLAGSPVVITMTDSWGDTWNGGFLTVNGVVYDQSTTAASSNTSTSDIYNVCLDLSTCIEAVYSVGNYYSEHSWSITDDAGVELASGVGAADTYTSLFGGCVTDCGDDTANNYNVDADIFDDSLCTYDLIQGCMDETACNYDVTAEEDDSSCTYADAGFDCDGNCLAGSPVSVTLTDAYGDGWNATDFVTINGVNYTDATPSFTLCLDLTSCISVSFSDDAANWSGEMGIVISDDSGTLYEHVGDTAFGAPVAADALFGGCVTDCGDDTANNYNADADIIDNDLCTYDVAQGCTDAEACNYDADAVVDDSSCTYAAAGLDCDGNCLEGVAWATTGAYPSEISFVVTDCDGTELFVSTGTEGCMPALPENGTVTLSDSYGDGGSDYGGDVLTIGGVVIYNSEEFTDTWSTSLGSCLVSGCIDPTACNYDAAADTDDGSCATALLVTTEVCASATEVRMTGPWWNWDPAGGPVAADNGDGTWTFTFCPAPTADMEFLLVVDGVQEDLVNAPHPDIDGDGYGDLWGCAPITDYFSYANRLWIDGSGDVTNTYGTCGSCSDVYGCMDVSANNYDASANVMDYAACTYPTVSNDLIGGAELLTMTAFGTCTSVSGTTAGASDSPESVNLWGGAYIDVWYEIVPTEAGVRIAVVTSSMDCMLELLDDQGDLVETADVNLSGEGEILFSNLTPGNSYFLSVQDYDNVGGTFEICAQELPASEVYGPNVGQVYPCSGYRGLSSTTSVSVAGGGTDWTFDDGVNTPITYSTPNSSVNLDVVPGLQSGTTYAVSIVPYYNDFGVTSQGTNEITIGAPSTGLKTQYINSTVALAQYSYVRCLQNTACSYESFDWRITDVNTGMVSNVNTPGDLLFLSAVTDITYASEYTAEIAVVYDDGNVGEYSAPQTFFTGAVPVTELRSIFNSSNTTLTEAQDISATPKVYLAADYEWYVERVDVTEIPFIYERGLAVRVARVNQMPLAAGGTYNLSVRPIVPGAVTEFGPAQEVVVIGGAGMVQDDEETSPEIAEETVIKDNLISASVTMYPNPANDFVTLNITGIAEGTDKVLVDIFNTVGQLVQSEQIPADGNYVNSVVTLNGLAEGMYNVQITVGNTVSSERMIIQK